MLYQCVKVSAAGLAVLSLYESRAADGRREGTIHHLWKKRRGAEIKTKIPQFSSGDHQYPHTIDTQPLFLVALVEATVFGSGCDTLPVKCHMTSVRRVDIV